MLPTDASPITDRVVLVSMGLITASIALAARATHASGAIVALDTFEAVLHRVRVLVRVLVRVPVRVPGLTDVAPGDAAEALHGA